MVEDVLVYPPGIALSALHEGCQKSKLPWNKTAYRCAFLEKIIETYDNPRIRGDKEKNKTYIEITKACKEKNCEGVSKLLEGLEVWHT
jgi:hypothetical protein